MGCYKERTRGELDMKNIADFTITKNKDNLDIELNYTVKRKNSSHFLGSFLVRIDETNIQEGLEIKPGSYLVDGDVLEFLSKWLKSNTIDMIDTVFKSETLDPSSDTKVEPILGCQMRAKYNFKVESEYGWVDLSIKDMWIIEAIKDIQDINILIENNASFKRVINIGGKELHIIDNVETSEQRAIKKQMQLMTNDEILETQRKQRASYQGFQNEALINHASRNFQNSLPQKPPHY